MPYGPAVQRTPPPRVRWLIGRSVGTRWLSRPQPIIILGMARRPRGLYRSPGWAYVTDGVETFDVRESDYRAEGYKPDYDGLPSKQDYDAAVAARMTAEKDGNA